MPFVLLRWSKIVILEACKIHFKIVSSSDIKRGLLSKLQKTVEERERERERKNVKKSELNLFEPVRKDSTLFQVRRLNYSVVTTRIISFIMTNSYRLNSEMTQFRLDTVPNCSIAKNYSCIKKTGLPRRSKNTVGGCAVWTGVWA